MENKRYTTIERIIAKIDNDFNEYITPKEFNNSTQNSKTGIYWFFGGMILLAIFLFIIILKFKR